MKENSKGRSSTKRASNNEYKSNQALDDALTLEVGSGNTAVVHGLAVDTFSRTMPVRVIPWFVRDTLFRAWRGMSGRRPNLGASPLPWYQYSTEGLTTPDSVAKRLTVTVQDAESWGSGVQTGAFSRYADMPMNPATMARFSFWRFDPLAAELDPNMALEPQAVALDAFSQLFTESASFHFGYLAEIDSEYHRLRALGPLGRLDSESSDREAWYNLYNYWRGQIESTYLSGSAPLVTLPHHLRQGNWTIADVLGEIYEMMKGDGGQLLSDIIITGKGFNAGMSGITLGVQNDASYLDADGNARFYHPYMENVSTINFDLAAVGIEHQLSNEHSTGDVVISNDYTAPATIPGTILSGTQVVMDQDVSPIWEMYAAQSSKPLSSSSSWGTVLQSHVAALMALPSSPGTPTTFAPEASGTGKVMANFLTLKSLPQSGDLMVGSMNYKYWSGHTLNLVELIHFAREIGRSVEPEVLNSLIFPMGVVSSCEAFVSTPSGASSRQIDELYNLYESGYSYNENPARLYTAAHLGPTNHKLGPNDLKLSGMPLTTTSGGNVVTARERYWTPAYITDARAEVIAAAFFPGAVFDLSLFRRIDVEKLAAFDNPRLRQFVARALGNVDSMLTKVEKPIYLPAGKSGPETVYASGVGLGAIQLVTEMYLALAGGSPRFGLGHGGFTDVRVDGSSNFINRAQASPGAYDSLAVAPHSLNEDAALLSSLTQGGSVDGMELGDIYLPYTDIPAVALNSQPVSFVGDGIFHQLENVDPTPGKPLTTGISGSTMSSGSSEFSAADPEGVYNYTRQAACGSRGIFGGNGTPVTTKVFSHHSGPRYSQWGERASTPAVYPHAEDFVDLAHPDMRCNVTVVKQPISATFVRNGESFVVPFVKDQLMLGMGRLEASGAYNWMNILATGVSAAHSGSHISNHFGHDLAPFVAETGGMFANLQGLNRGDYAVNTRKLTTYGTWSNDSYNEFTATTSNDGPNVRRVAPLITPHEIILQAFSAGHAIYNAEADWSNDITEFTTVTLKVAEYMCYDTKYSGQSTFADGGWDNPSRISTPYRPYKTCDYTHSFRLRDATAAELKLNDGHLTFSSEISSTGMSSLEVDLEPLYSVGTALIYLGSATIGGGLTKINAAIDSVVGIAGTTVCGFRSDSTHRRLGGIWSAPKLTVDHPTLVWNGTGGDAGIKALIPKFEPTVGGLYGNARPWYNVGSFADNAAPLGYPGIYDAIRVGWNLDSGADGVASHDALSTGAQYGSLGVELNEMGAIIGASAQHIPLSVAGPGTQLTYVYPDEPKHKMLYRPWRRIADASIAKELRMIFANDGEDTTMRNGPLGIKCFGTPGQFRFAELLDAGMADTFILEQASSKTRLTSASHRSVLTFTKNSLQDIDEQRHTVPDVMDEINQTVIGMGAAHRASVTGTQVLTRALIRDLQLGRQYQKL